MGLTLSFGKYRGKTLEWLFFQDPGYVWWLEDEFHQRPGIIPHADRKRFKALLQRASSLVLPGICPWCRERPISRMFLTAKAHGEGLGEVVFGCDSCEPPPRQWTWQAARPGFRTPDFFRDYDKAGGKILVRALKLALFGDAASPMTHRRLEEFWQDPTRFAVPVTPSPD